MSDGELVRHFGGVAEIEKVRHVDGDFGIVFKHISEGYRAGCSWLQFRQIGAGIVAFRIVQVHGGVEFPTVLEHFRISQHGEGVVLIGSVGPLVGDEHGRLIVVVVAGTHCGYDFDVHIGEIAFHVLLAFRLGVGFGGIIGFGVLIGVRRRGLRRACARDVVKCLAGGRLHGQGDDDGQHRQHRRDYGQGFATLFASERAHDGHDRQYRADESEDRRDVVDDWNEAQHQAERAEHHSHDATYRRALRSRGRHDRRGSHTVRRCRAVVGNRSIVELTHDLFLSSRSGRNTFEPTGSASFPVLDESPFLPALWGARLAPSCPIAQWHVSMSMPIMGVMSVITNPSTAEVPVRTRIWCTVPMVVCASFACLAQVSFASQQYAQDSAPYLWMIACVLVAIPSGLILLARNSYPQAVFWTACLLVVALPYDSLIALMALTSLLARRQGTKVTLRSVLAAATTTIWSQVRDALHPAEASIWHAIFSKPYTGVRYGNTMVMLVDERTIIASAVVVALIAVAIATLAGLHIRSRALARVAEAKAQSANEQVSRLRTTLDNQQLADAIAAEAHDTLAHSLSLLALNASALQAESRKLKAEAEQLGNANVAGMAGKIAGTTEDIRRQASGALDEAHSVIDMLRHPEDARLQLAANDAEASLTRNSLLQLIGDARAANMRIDTWIDVQQLGQLDESIGVIAYHVVQEGLTNVRRHAPGAPVSLQVDANPPQGVHVHVSNPTMPQSPSHMADTRKGAGLPGLAKRIQQAGGTCQYGFDQHNVFHLDVRLPWVG